MSKTTRTLSGAAKNSFLKGVVKSALGDDHDARDRLMAELTAAIASLRVRVEAERGRKRQTAAQPSAAPASPNLEPAATPPSSSKPFDPYSPNVIVVIRTRGRDAALTELTSIATEQNLRLLAREQQLGIPKDTMSLSEIRDAIIAAAERRIANRLAAGR